MKIPPHFHEGEKVILGCCLLDETCVPTVCEQIEEKDFYTENNRQIFSTIYSAFKKNIPVDFVSVSKELFDAGKFESIGGSDYLSNLLESVPSTANIQHYIDIVKEKSLLRKIITFNKEIMSMCYNNDELTEIVNKLQTAAISVIEKGKKENKTEHIKDILHKIIASLDSQETGNIPSGLLNLDKIINGFHPSDLIIICGRPGMGKTAIAGTVALHAAQNNHPVYIFSLEMSKIQLTQRFISAKSGVNLQHIRFKEFSQWNYEKIIKAAGDLSDLPIWINDISNATPANIQARIKDLTIKTKKPPKLVIIDYLQLMSPNEKTQSREQQISSITRDLKKLAKDINTPIIAIAQLNRNLENRPFDDKHQRRPRLSDLRESGAIEQDADIVIGMYRPEVYCNKDNPIEISKYKNKAEACVIKHRNGPLGIAKLIWDPETTTFKDSILINEQQYPEAINNI